MISVLMSVYNETLDEIRQSIDSILSQTYTDFELIIVLDQPKYSEGLVLLKKYAEQDNRVKILVNEKNIGLALSMNYAAEHACGEYLLRMDADDICMPDRFQLEYDVLQKGNYDLICGNYDFIDEGGNLLPQKPVIYTDRQITALLPYRNIIHHPTVIMTTEIFQKCAHTLAVVPQECLYVGDGGSFELETAQAIGMHPIQAAWYLKDGVNQPAKRKAEFVQAESPMDVLFEIAKHN